METNTLFNGHFCTTLILYNPAGYPTARSFLLKLHYRGPLPFVADRTSDSRFTFRDDDGISTVTVLPSDYTDLYLDPGSESYDVSFCGKFKSKYNTDVSGYVSITTQLGRKCALGSLCNKWQQRRFERTYGGLEALAALPHGSGTLVPAGPIVAESIDSRLM